MKMRNDIFDIIRKQGLRLVMSAIATSFCANIYAQDVDDDSSDDEKVVDDMARLTDGAVQIDLNMFKFEKVTAISTDDGKKGRRRK